MLKLCICDDQPGDLERLEGFTAEFFQSRPDLPALVETFRSPFDLLERLEDLTGNDVLLDIPSVEPIGPKGLLDVLVICPCTGNTLAKLAHGVTDTAVTMAAKAHLRNGRPLVLAIATNDGLAGSAPNLGTMLGRKHVYLVPFGQDDHVEKPASLVADFTQIPDTVEAAMRGEQLQPLLLGCG